MSNNRATSKITVTSINDLKSYASGTLVELPPFAEGQPFIAKLRRPSLLALVKAGKIPNALLEAANSLFTGEKSKSGLKPKDNTNSMSEMFEVFDILCEASFVEPSWKDLKSAGVELTDEQMIYVFNYTQNGVKALNSFRKE